MNRSDTRRHRDRSRSKKRRYYGESSSTGLYYRQEKNHYHYEDKNKKRRRRSTERSRSNQARSLSVGSPLKPNQPQLSMMSQVQHIEIRRGAVLNNKYQVHKLLGDGTFGRVVECEYRGAAFAVKIIKPVLRYIESAKVEKSIIKRINKHDPNDTEGIVRYKESFYHEGHFCMVFKPLGKSLFDFLKLNSFRGFPIKIVQSFFKQILRSIGFLHKIGYTHTDLKPENILLEHSQYEEVSKEEHNGKQPYFLPSSNKIRIIDFGGATRFDELHGEIINTRQYRSPEVILQCCQWNEISDIWSIGCIIVELLAGRQVFPTRQNKEHLAMIEKNCGRFPSWMIQKTAWPHKEQENLRSLFLDGLIDQDQVPTLGNVVRNPMLEELMPEQKELVHLIRKCLEIDPNRRINCKSALNHPFFDIKF